MTDDQLQYCSNYHRAMVEPFTDNRSWYRLQREASLSWGEIFGRFSNLEIISVGCCRIVDQPSPTSTHTFLLQHGKTVIHEPSPSFVDDATVNMAWASSMVIRTAPTHVQELRLSLANMDNFNSFATINRLQSFSFRKPFNVRIMKTTRMRLALRGINGTHGSKDWTGDTGSAGSVRHWKTMLNSLEALQHLELYNVLSSSDLLPFSRMELSDQQASILDWILPDLRLKHLRTLRLCGGLLLDADTILNALSGHWPSLERLTIEDASLMLRDNDKTNTRALWPNHLEGESWLYICRTLISRYPGVYIHLNRVSSNYDDTHEHVVHPKYVNEIRGLPGVEIDPGEPYRHTPQIPQVSGGLFPKRIRQSDIRGPRRY
jgi:hypothetical protein